MKAFTTTIKTIGMAAFCLIGITAIAVAGTTTPAPVAATDPFAAAWNARGPSNSIDELLKLRLQNGYQNLYKYSATLTMEALEANAQGRDSDADDLLDKASDLAPDFWGPSFAESKINLGKGKVLNAFAPFVNGVQQEINSINGRIPILFNLVSILMKAFYLSVLLFAGVLAAKNLNLAAHDVTERFGRFTPLQAELLSAGVILLPAAIAPHMIVYSSVVFLILWLYLTNRERVAIALMTLVLLTAPYFFNRVGYSIAAMGDPVLNAIAEVREGEWGDSETKALEKALTEGRDPVLTSNVSFSLATIYMYGGRFEDSERLYKDLENNPGLKFESTLMLGNLYFRALRYADALKKYQEACVLNKQSFECHFNMAAALSRPELVNTEAGYVERSDREQEAAKAIDFDRFDTLTRYQAFIPGKMVVDARIPLKNIFDTLFVENADKGSASEKMFESVSGGIPMFMAPAMAIITLVLFGIFTWMSSRIDVAKSCRRCGKTFCSKCQTQSVKGVSCVRCHNAFEQSTGMDPRMREKVRAESRLYNERLAKIAQVMTIILPGSGHVFEGRPFRGFLFSFLAFVFWVWLGAKNGIIGSSWPNPDSTMILPVAVFFILYIILILLAAWDARARRN